MSTCCTFNGYCINVCNLRILIKGYCGFEFLKTYFCDVSLVQSYGVRDCWENISYVSEKPMNSRSQASKPVAQFLRVWVLSEPWQPSAPHPAPGSAHCTCFQCSCSCLVPPSTPVLLAPAEAGGPPGGASHKPGWNCTGRCGATRAKGAV